MSVITTDKFRISSKQYFRAEAFHLARKLFWGVLVLLLSIIVAAIYYNTVFIYVGLILIFLILPPLIGLIYYTKLLTVEAQRSLAEKWIIITPGYNITVKFDDSRISEYTILWEEIGFVNQRNGIIELRDNNDNILLLIPKMFITSCQCFDEFLTDMNWEEKKNN